MRSRSSCTLVCGAATPPPVAHLVVASPREGEREMRKKKKTPPGNFRAFFARTICTSCVWIFRDLTYLYECATTRGARATRSMGIAGLSVSGSLGDVVVRVNLPACFPNARLGVDISHWFHASVYPSVEAFVRCPSANLGHVERIVERASRLRHAHGFDPIFVFDGASLPSKSAEHAKRAEQRTAALLLANQERDQTARLKLFANAAERSMEYWTIPVFDALVRSGFKCVMAPYEADPQLAYMSRRGDVDVVLSRDGDMVAHGCRVVALEFEERDGSALVVRREDLLKHASFEGLSPDSFVHVCILSGCDYLARSVFPGRASRRSLANFAKPAATKTRSCACFKISGQPTSRGARSFPLWSRSRTRTCCARARGRLSTYPPCAHAIRAVRGTRCARCLLTRICEGVAGKNRRRRSRRLDRGCRESTTILPQ